MEVVGTHVGGEGNKGAGIGDADGVGTVVVGPTVVGEGFKTFWGRRMLAQISRQRMLREQMVLKKVMWV